MNEQYILKKDHLASILRKLGKSNQLVAPLRNELGDTLFCQVENLENSEIDLDNQPQNSLKQFFFPQTETLSSYLVDHEPDGGKLRYKFYPHLPENLPTVYFGVRSCDMFGVLYTDLIFLQSSTKDIYYKIRRDNAIFITLACNTPFPNCFCNATRTGPHLEMGYDLQLTDLGDRYFVEVGRARGVRLVNEWAPFFTPASQKDRQFQFQAALEARGLFNKQVHVDLALRLLAEEPEPVEILGDLSSRCQDCGGCAFICPTCVCFNIYDQPTGEDKGERIRNWDACTFSGFTKMAGDHNPVEPETQRVRKRFLHKLKHDVEKHGRPSCVGCGRCVGMCFGGVDIVRFIDMLSELEDSCLEREF
ncbi:MAG: 4Fe-4S dicluster domain-containing protein [Desulfobulbaceae bacterium]|nr:4Fe-4S dicluster domain-containing protein [Desulfobulbaceae bacterium]